MGCATACCARITATPDCRRRSRSSIRPTSSGAIKRLLKANNIDDERYPPRNLQLFISSSKEAGLRAKDVEVNDDYNRKFVELYALYDAQCNREGVADFSELLLRCYELLDRNEILRSTTRTASATSWSTSFRTPTSCSTRG